MCFIAHGINYTMITQLKERVATFYPKDKVVTVMFDKVSIKRSRMYDKSSGKVEGYKYFGGSDRTSNIPYHALVFMVQGVARR